MLVVLADSEVLARPELSDLGTYLQGAEGDPAELVERRRVQMANALAGRYASYQAWRPELLTAGADGGKDT